MATTTNYGWTTPDDTALVKDGASAIRTLGSSVDTTTKNLNPSTTLGDIEYRSSTANTNTRLGIGTTGQILTVSSGVPAWTTPTGGGSNFSLLNAGGTSLSGNSTSITGISGMNKLLIVVKDASHTSAFDGGLTITFNSNSGNVYDTQEQYSVALSSYGTGVFGASSSTTSSITLFSTSTNAASTGSGYLLVDGCNSSGVKVYEGAGGANAGGGNSQSPRALGGIFNSSSTISSVQIKWQSTLVSDGGSVFIYGSA